MTNQSDTIYIIGNGAIGRALAVFLRLAGQCPVLVRGSVLKTGSRNERIRVETVEGEVREANIGIATLDAFGSLDGPVVLATKSYGNERLSRLLRDKIGDSPLVLLQNGLGVERPFLERGFPQLYRAVLFVTSQPMHDGTIRFRLVEASPVGTERGTDSGQAGIVSRLHTPDFAFRGEADIRPVIWRKAIVNCVFNSVCPLLEADNGLLHRNVEARVLARRIIAECTAVAVAKGISIREEEVEESLLRISRSSEGQFISTLQDIRSHRPVEMDSLNFEIVRVAQSLGLGDRVLETRLLGELTALKAELARETLN